MLKQNNEDHRVALQMIKAVQTWSNSHFDSHVHPCTFSEGDLVLIYDQATDKLGKGKFDSMWYKPYIVRHCLGKGAYLFADSNDHLLKNPHNGLYLKRFYS